MVRVIRDPAPDAEPNVLPRGMAPLNLAYFCLAMCDFALAGGMLSQWAAATDHSGLSLIIGPVLGVELALVYQVYPPGGLHGRDMTAVAAYRLMLRLLLFAHLPLVAAGVLDASHGGGSAVFIALPGAVLASAGLYPVGLALRTMRWLDPAAAPEDFEPLIGLDAAKPAQDRIGRMSLFTAFALPFLPAVFAGRRGLAVSAGVIWLAGIAAMAAFPAGAILPGALLLIILWQQSVYRFVYGDAAPMLFAAALTPEEKTARRPALKRILTPARLHPPPITAPLGRLALPLLVVLDYFALVTLIALQTAGAFAPFLADIGVACLVLPPLMLAVLVPVMALIARGGDRLYLIVGALAALAEIPLALLATAASFHIPIGPVHVTVPSPVYPVIWPLTWLLLAGLPMTVMLLGSLVQIGRT